MFASNIALAKKYDYLAEKFTKAYDWLANNDVTKMEDGRYDICDGVFALVQRYTTMPFEKARFEAHNDYFDIQYTWGDNLISIRPNHDGYVRIRFDVMMRQGIQHLIRETADMYAQMDNYNSNSIIDNITAVGVMKRRLSKFVSEIFGDSDEVIYIPAGRSLLATLSEDLWGLSTDNMDLTMKEFISLIQRTRSNFGTRIPEMIKDYTKTVKGQIIMVS